MFISYAIATVFSFISFTGYFRDTDEYLDNLSMNYGTENSAPFLAISIITATFGTAVTIAILHLIVLHIYLNYKGITTYDHIIEVRKKKKKVTPK